MASARALGLVGFAKPSAKELPMDLRRCELNRLIELHMEGAVSS